MRVGRHNSPGIVSAGQALISSREHVPTRSERAMRIGWRGIFPALSTPCDDSGALDEGNLREQVRWSIENGAHGIIESSFSRLPHGPPLTEEDKAELNQILAEPGLLP
jgi:hypothetical protein